MRKLNFNLLISFLFLFVLQVNSKELSSLKHETIKRIAFRHDTLLNLAHTSHSIGFVVFTEDGKITRSKGFLKGSLRSSSLKIEVENGHLFFGKLYIDKRKADKDFNNVPLKFWSKYEPDKVFYDTLWLNTEKKIYILPIDLPKKRVPGAKFKFGVEVLYDNDEYVSYTNPTAFENMLPEFDILLKGGKYNNGVFTISPDFFDYPDHHPGVGIQLRKDSSIFDIFEIEMDYIDQYYLSASGSSGMFGSSGSSSQNGNHGQDGQFGEHGTQGHDVDVYADVYFDSILQKPLMKVFVENLTRNYQKRYLINPDGGKLRIDASGGNGGSGGSGGSGGNGADGYTGEVYYETIKEIIIKKDTAGKEIRVEITKQIPRQRPGGNGGNGGDGGFGGVGGNGGNGGYVIVHYTHAMQSYLHLLSVNVSGGWYGSGGSGGSGGKGGNGGQGNPRGRNGVSGHDGLNAPNGYSGSSGRVEYKTVNEIPW